MPLPVFDSSSGKRAKGKTPFAEKLLVELESFAEYDEEAGGFIVTRCRNSRSPVGSAAGTIDTSHGYRKLVLKTEKGKYHKCYIHHLVWLWHYGAFPKNEIDHLDGNPLNNRIENLRDLTRTMQMRNCRLDKRSISGFTGVTWHEATKKWRARVVVDKKEYYLGIFDSAEEAFEARLKFINQRQFGGFTDRHLFNDTGTNQSTNTNLRISL